MNDEQPTEPPKSAGESSSGDAQTVALRIPSPPMSARESRRAHKAIENALRDLWGVVDDLSTLLPPRPTYYRVTIFGSSRMNEGDDLYPEVRRLAERLSAMGIDIVTGGGPGLMQAANEGELRGDVGDQTYSIGLNVDLPHEQRSNPYVERLYQHGTFFSRLHHFVHLSSAFVVMPGGVGTTLEAMLVWQLAQVGHLEHRPLIFIGEMWQELVDWGRAHWVEGRRTLADPQDIEIPVCVPTVDRAVEVIEENLAWWEEHGGVDRIETDAG
ncbi:MAG: LOG family protein [Gemmatimonadota bacterium]